MHTVYFKVLILKVQDFGNLELLPMYKLPTIVISFLIILKMEEDSGSVSSVRLGIEGLLGQESPEPLCCHTGQCKHTGGCYKELVVAFFSTGGGVKCEKIYTC